MKPRTVEVKVTETLIVEKTVTLHLEADFDSDDTDEIEQRARAVAYAELAITPESSWELTGSDGPDFEVGEPEFDYSKMTNDEEARILAEIVTGLSVDEIFGVGMVESTLREELNNDVLSEVGEDCTEESFREAFRNMVHNLSAAQLLGYGDVYSELREEYNNTILEWWANE